MAKDLKMHMLQHDAKNPHSCNKCSYSSINAAHLKRHMLVHSGENPFVCKECDYSCARADSLKTHMLTHSEKPFVCIQRNYLFTQAGCLQTHMLIHSGETLLDCTECNYSCKNHKEHIQGTNPLAAHSVTSPPHKS